jgi:hypothetical protein
MGVVGRNTFASHCLADVRSLSFFEASLYYQAKIAIHQSYYIVLHS